jgi:hypothetical protein
VLLAQLEETRLTFHVLVESLTEAKWTVREVMTHLALALTVKPEKITHVKGG